MVARTLLSLVGEAAGVKGAPSRVIEYEADVALPHS